MGHKILGDQHGAVTLSQKEVKINVVDRNIGALLCLKGFLNIIV